MKKSNLATNLGSLFQEKRREIGFSVEDLAKKTELSVGTIRAVEQGRRQPSAPTLKKLLVALEIENGRWLDECTWVGPDEIAYTLARFQGDNRRKPATSNVFLPKDVCGNIRTSAEYGISWIVQVTYYTDYDGRKVDVEKEDLPRTLHGPFFSEEEANSWIYAYPDDEDIEDMVIQVINNVR